MPPTTQWLAVAAHRLASTAHPLGTAAHPLATAAYTPFIGWGASAVLLATIGTQIYRQWKSGTSKGVSLWLFVGQALASVGFSLYSFLVGDWVFIFTNLLMLAAAFVGLSLVLWHRKKNPEEAEV